MRRVNLNGLHMFDAAARHLNFRLAAEELNLTQGAVAQQVRLLEKNLDLRLFDRKARGLELTRAGRTYHEDVHKALRLIDDAHRKLRPEPLCVTLSVTPSFASKWLVPRLRSFTDRHPDIELQTVASEVLADFRTDGVDIAIRQGCPPFAGNLRLEFLAPLHLCAVCSPELRRKIEPVRTLETFRDHVLIQDSHQHWNALLEEVGIPFGHRTLQFNQTALAMDAAANGQGVALAPRLYLAEELENGRLVKLWEDTRSDQSGFYIVYPDPPACNPARDTVAQWILKEI